MGNIVAREGRQDPAGGADKTYGARNRKDADYAVRPLIKQIATILGDESLQSEIESLYDETREKTPEELLVIIRELLGHAQCVNRQKQQLAERERPRLRLPESIVIDMPAEEKTKVGAQIPESRLRV